MRANKGNFGVIARIQTALQDAKNRKLALKEIEKQTGLKLNPQTIAEWLKLILEYLPLFISLFAKR